MTTKNHSRLSILRRNGVKHISVRLNGRHHLNVPTTNELKTFGFFLWSNIFKCVDTLEFHILQRKQNNNNSKDSGFTCIQNQYPTGFGYAISDLNWKSKKKPEKTKMYNVCST